MHKCSMGIDMSAIRSINSASHVPLTMVLNNVLLVDEMQYLTMIRKPKDFRLRIHDDMFRDYQTVSYVLCSCMLQVCVHSMKDTKLFSQKVFYNTIIIYLWHCVR